MTICVTLVEVASPPLLLKTTAPLAYSQMVTDFMTTLLFIDFHQSPHTITNFLYTICESDGLYSKKFYTLHRLILTNEIAP